MHKYRITIEDLNRAGNQGNTTSRSVSFSAENHDDLFHIIEVVRSKKLVDFDKSAALAIGLKLLSEVALEKRRDPLFAPLSEPPRSFIEQLKAVPSAHL